MADDGFSHVHGVHFGELKRQRRRDMSLFVDGLADVELASLTIVVGKAGCADAALLAAFAHRGAAKAARRDFARGILLQRTWLVVDPAFGLLHLHMRIALLIRHRTLRRIDRKLMKVRRAQAR